jgi:hypothetical protein
VAALLVLTTMVYCDKPTTSIELLPGVPSPKIYMDKPTSPPIGTYFSVNMTYDPPVASFMLIISRDTTRSGLVVWWSTTKQRPNFLDHDGELRFNQQTNGHRFSVVNNPVMHGMYYFGINVAFESPAAAEFSAMVTFYNVSQFAPSDSGNFTLSSNLLSVTSPKEVPSITASWTGLSKFRNYTFYKFSRGCGVDPLMSDLEYVVNQGTPFHEVELEDPTTQTISTVLTDFEDDISTFCLNLVAVNKYGVPETIWLAQTIYYPHLRDGIEPEKVDPKHWTPYTWTAVILTSALFIGAPIGIIVHRIWISRRRAQKRREALLSGPTWIN